MQEVLRSQQLTRVPLAPTAVAGLINLRGQVVTAIELRERLGRPPRPEGTDAVVIVVRLHGEAVSLLVDSIADVVDVDASDFEAPPDTLEGQARDLIRGAYKLDGQLLCWPRRAEGRQRLRGDPARSRAGVHQRPLTSVQEPACPCERGGGRSGQSRSVAYRDGQTGPPSTFPGAGLRLPMTTGAGSAKSRRRRCC